MCYDRSALAQMAAVVWNPPALQETQETVVQSLHWEGPLQAEKATLSSTPAWEIPRTEEPGSPRGCKEVDTTECAHTHTNLRNSNFFILSILLYFWQFVLCTAVRCLFSVLFLAALGLRCFAWTFSSCGKRGLLFIAGLRLLTSAVSLAVKHGL